MNQQDVIKNFKFEVSKLKIEKVKAEKELTKTKLNQTRKAKKEALEKAAELEEDIDKPHELKAAFHGNKTVHYSLISSEHHH